MREYPNTEPIGYAAWRARAFAELEGPNLLLERHWRRAYILGRSTNEVVEEARALLYNARISKRRRG
jgi:hypothetical protein